jgi:beta-glucosidase
MGYPVKDVPALKPIEKFFRPGDDQRLVFAPDFVGVQNYTRQVVKYSPLVPFVRLTTESPRKKGLPVTEMGWEVYPEGLYHSLKFYGAYPGVRKLYVTESGVAYPDVVQNGRVRDQQRIEYFRDYLAQTLRAKQEGVPVEGYLAWSLLDNFEWVEGYKPRFGLVHVDFHTQERTIKDSGYWFRALLTGEPIPPYPTAP